MMLKRLQTTLLMAVMAIVAMAQGQIKGRVLDKNSNEALSFVSVSLTQQASKKVVAGATTDADGAFNFQNVKNGNYVLTLNFIGYKQVTKQVTINAKDQHHNFPALYMSEDAQMLKEVQVTGQRAAMKLEVDRKSFDVSGMIANAGQSASEVLENIPSVEVDNDGNVSLRGNSSVEVWINGRASGMTADNRAQILQQLPAESIERIEVIDNPSSKYSAEGSAGIINIILKKDRKAGYYGSVQVGADTRSGANTSFNINYNSSKIDAYFNIGYRHRENEGQNKSEQDNFRNGVKTSYERHNSISKSRGNMLFGRAGLTWHATDKDDFSVSGMLFTGKNKNYSNTPYYYGIYNADGSEMLNSIRQRDSYSGGPMRMYNVEFNYRHNFSETNFLDLIVSHHQWKSDQENIYQDSIYTPEQTASSYDYQSRPLNIKNNSTEVRLDYEGKLNDALKLEAGYNGNYSREKTPQMAYRASNWNGNNLVIDEPSYNDFKYNLDVHALYANLAFNKDKIGIMAGLRGEYWKVNSQSENYAQAQGTEAKNDPFKKDYFQLFPSIFMSYQLTKTQQLQLNYVRRLRRPWGGQLNNFKNTSDASMVSMGNPELTPEYSNSFSLNYLKTWEQHSLLVSAYYRPTTDVIQRIVYRGFVDGIDHETMISTSENVAKSQSTGIEVTLKNKLWKRLDITTNVNAYYYKLDAFAYQVLGQTVTGEANDNFTWNARIIAALTLPYDISVQASGRFNSRQVITQGHRPASYGLDLGVRKNFFNRKLTLAINCRDVLNTRKFESETSSETFYRYQVNRRRSRTVNFTLTYNFGNGANNKKRRPDQQGGDEDDATSMGGYDM